MNGRHSSYSIGTAGHPTYSLTAPRQKPDDSLDPSGFWQESWIRVQG